MGMASSEQMRTRLWRINNLFFSVVLSFFYLHFYSTLFPGSGMLWLWFFGVWPFGCLMFVQHCDKKHFSLMLETSSIALDNVPN